jgi:hypothetical protein
VAIQFRQPLQTLTFGLILRLSNNNKGRRFSQGFGGFLLGQLGAKFSLEAFNICEGIADVLSQL